MNVCEIPRRFFYEWIVPKDYEENILNLAGSGLCQGTLVASCTGHKLNTYSVAFSSSDPTLITTRY